MCLASRLEYHKRVITSDQLSYLFMFAQAQVLKTAGRVEVYHSTLFEPQFDNAAHHRPLARYINIRYLAVPCGNGGFF